MYIFTIVIRQSTADAMQREELHAMCKSAAGRLQIVICSMLGTETYLEVCNSPLMLSSLYLDHCCLVRLKDLLPTLHQPMLTSL